MGGSFKGNKLINFISFFMLNKLLPIILLCLN